MAALALALCAVVCLGVAAKSGAAIPLVLGGIEFVAAGGLWLMDRLS